MYGSLIETLPAVVYVAEAVTPYSTIYVSRNIERLGYSLEEWMSAQDSWLKILHPDDRETVLFKTQEAMNRGGENDYEYRVIAKDKSIYWLHDKGKFVLAETGKPICWQGVLLDITERKQAEQERENLINQLQAALQEIKTLSGLLPICSYCKNIRNDENYWEKIDKYLTEHSSVQFTHGVCPECYDNILKPQIEKIKKQNKLKQ